MSLLDALIYGVRTVYTAGSAVTQRSGLNFVSGATVADNAATGNTDVTITQAGSALSLLADFASSTSASAQATNLTVAVGASDVGILEFGGNWSLASGTSGCKLAINAPTGALLEGAAHGELATGLSTYTSAQITAIATLVGPFNTVSATSEGVWGSVRIKMDGVHSGNITFQVAPVAAVVLTLKKGFWMRWRTVTEV